MSIKEFCAYYIAHQPSELEDIANEKACVKSLISAAQMFALGCIDIEDVCYCLSCEEADLPSEFYTYAELYGTEYEVHLKLQALVEDINNQLK